MPELGADVLVDYREEDFVARVLEATDGHGADVILDNMGAKYLARNVDCPRHHGRLVIIGMQGGTTAELDLNALLRKRGSRHRDVAAGALRCREGADRGGGAQARVAARRSRAGAADLQPPSAGGCAAAHREMEASGHIGKILLTTG